jgi:hypothetical protein
MLLPLMRPPSRLSIYLCVSFRSADPGQVPVTSNTAVLPLSQFRASAERNQLEQTVACFFNK